MAYKPLFTTQEQVKKTTGYQPLFAKPTLTDVGIGASPLQPIKLTPTISRVGIGATPIQAQSLEKKEGLVSKITKGLVKMSPLLGQIKPLTEKLGIKEEETFFGRQKEATYLLAKKDKTEEEKKRLQELAEETAFTIETGFLKPVSKALTTVKKIKNLDEAFAFLKNIGAPDIVAKRYSQSVVNATTDKQVINLLDAVSRVVKPQVKTPAGIVKQIDEPTKKEMIQAIDYIRLDRPKKKYNQQMEEIVGSLADKYGFTTKKYATIADKFEELVDGTMTSGTKKLEVLKGADDLVKVLNKRRVSPIPSLEDKTGDGIVVPIKSLGRKEYLPLLEEYKGYDIVKAGDDISVWDKNKETLFRVAEDDSKRTGVRFIDENNNTIEGAKKYIDLITTPEKYDLSSIKITTSETAQGKTFYFVKDNTGKIIANGKTKELAIKNAKSQLTDIWNKANMAEEVKKFPTIHQGGKIKMVEGEPVKIVNGVETFLHKGDGGWIVSETSTGKYIAESRSKEGVIAKTGVILDEQIENIGGVEQLKQLISKQKLSITKGAKKSPEVAKIIDELPQEIQQQTKELAGTAIERLTKAITSAKPIREETEKLYSMARGLRIGAAEAVGQKVKGEKGFFAQLSKLKGALPKKQFEGVRNQFAQKEVDSLFDAIQETNLLPFEKITAKSALAKLFEGSVPTRNEIELLREVFPKTFIDAILKQRPRSEKIFEVLGNLINAPRTLVASIDFSAPFRQGVFLIGRPKQFLPDFVKMFKYAFSEKAYQGGIDSIKARPTYKQMREGKLALTDIGGSLNKAEELFMGNIVEKIPGIGQLVKVSNRAYIGFLNQLRADVFDDFIRKAGQLGIKQDEKFLNSTAKYINAATGRGNLPAVLERAAPVLNAIFFSPRLMASRINLMNPYFYVNLDPFVRKQALRDLLVFGSLGTSVLGLASLNDNVEIGADPRNADFGKIKVGNTRYDIFGGFQQYIRLASQLISGEIVSSTTGRTMTIGEGFGVPNRFDIALRFFENKTAPLPSFLIGLLKGETSIGDDFDVPTEIANRMVSFVIQDLYDIAKERGIENIWEGLPAIFGIGMQTYGQQELVEGKNKLGEQTQQIRPVRGLTEVIREAVLGKEPLGTSKNFSIEAYYDQLNELPREEAKEIFNKIIEGNPELAKKLSDVIREREKGITPKDKDLKTKGVASGDRAIEIKNRFDKLKTKEEKKQLWSEYIEKGIITEEVARQLIILFENN